MFQPVDPGDDNSEAQTAYKVAASKWSRSPAQSACRAYLAARGEVRVLYWVSHAYVVPFLGLSQSPLAIVMPRAPRGALDSVLADLRRSGAKVERESAQIVILQIAKALEYLHSHRIIVRDLKSENVLVWNFPQAFASREERTKVDLKLADYGKLNVYTYTGFCITFVLILPGLMQ
jgi:serine/threonine protein kinase